MLKENFITVKEFKDLTDISKQRVNQLMYGSHRKYKKKNGELKIYFQKLPLYIYIKSIYF